MAASPSPADRPTLTDLKSVGLRWSSDQEPGYRRQKRGKRWIYRDPDGERVTDKEVIDRLNKLAVPPAYTDVWLCKDPRGHLQATGRDAKGRKQYRYHPLWREVRDAAKYHSLVDFAEALPGLRRRINHDLRREGLPPEKVIAAVVRLLEETMIRVGNDEYARTNESYGLTTLRDQHVDVEGPELHFEFRGKGGKEWQVDVRDPKAARVVEQCQDLPGQTLFQYLDDNGNRHAIGSTEVNEYLHNHCGPECTAKDFRTWGGTVMAFRALKGPTPDTKRETQSRIKQALELVARELRNTPAIARRCYVHPLVLEAFEDGRLEAERARAEQEAASAPDGLRKDEKIVWQFLKNNTPQVSESTAKAAV